MAKAKRNIGREILEGLSEIKRGEYGRVVNIPDVAGVREKTGLSQSRFAACPFGRCRIGSRVAVSLPARLARCCRLLIAIPGRCWTLHELGDLTKRWSGRPQQRYQVQQPTQRRSS